MSVIRWTRILATTDFSPFGNKAVAHAHELAEKFGAELHVLHVASNPTEAAILHGSAGTHGAAETDDAGGAWINQILGERGDIRRIDAVRIGTDVADKIAHYAQEHAIDLIVLASHGRTGLAHLWLGSVAEKVVRSVHCPVLVLRPTPEDLAAKQPTA